MKFIFSIVLAFGLATAAYAQSPSKILKQAEKALGGSKLLKSVRSVSKTGRVTRFSDRVEGFYSSQTAQPNLFNESLELGGFEIESGYNGRSGWARNSRDGLQTLNGDAGLALQAKAAYRNALWLNYKNERSRIISGGQASVDGKNANIVILKTIKGVTMRLFFDAMTGLPVRDEITIGDVTETRDHSDYRDVAGTKQSYFEKVTIGDQAYEIRFGEIKLNAQIARSEFDFPNVSGKPLPDIPTLLAELQANEDKVEAILDTYSFNQKIIKRELGKDGVLREKESETYQLSFYKGNRIKRLIEKNGRPLSAKDQAEADKDAAEQAEKLEKEAKKEESKIGKQSSSGAPSNDSRRISIAEVLRASKLTNPRRERFRARDVIVFDFEPNPDFDLSNAKSMLKFFGKTAGVMWIDESDKQVVRLDAVLFESFKVGGGFVAKLKKGASFTLEQERVGDEIWLPAQADINLSVRLFLVKGIDLNQVIKSYDYHKFETEVKDAEVKDVVKP